MNVRYAMLEPRKGMKSKRTTVLFAAGWMQRRSQVTDAGPLSFTLPLQNLKASLPGCIQLSEMCRSLNSRCHTSASRTSAL